MLGGPSDRIRPEPPIGAVCPNNAVRAAQNALEWLTPGYPNACITANTTRKSGDPPGTVH